jgi:hypothetical protein
MLTLNDLLTGCSIDPQTTIVFRHRPNEPKLRKVFRWLAGEKPEVFNAYQQTQGDRAEAALLKASHVASFIGHEAGKALFVGLYEVGTARPMTFEQYWATPAYVEMKENLA